MEHCYGLRRRDVSHNVTDGGMEATKLHLTFMQKLCSVAYITVVPFMIKTLKDYSSSDLARERSRASAMPSHRSLPSTSGSYLASFTHTLAFYAERFSSSMHYMVNRSLPYAELALDLSHVAYQFLYLTKYSQYHDIIFALLQMRLEKSGHSVVVDASVDDAKTTTSSSSSVPTSRSISTMHIIMAIIISLRVTEYVHNYTQSTEHQSQSLSTRLAEPIKLPVAPMRPPSAQGCLSPPRDHSLCALCSERQQDPCVCSSGYVFCYLCILEYVREHGRCPITAMPCREGEIIKLFVGAHHGEEGELGSM